MDDLSNDILVQIVEKPERAHYKNIETKSNSSQTRQMMGFMREIERYTVLRV